MEGQWAEGKLNGLAKYTLVSGEIFEGTFVNDVPHGHVCHTAPDGSLYDGPFVDGKRCGYGKSFSPP